MSYVTFFEMKSWAKRSIQWTYFLFGFQGPWHFGASMASTPIFSAKTWPKYPSQKIGMIACIFVRAQENIIYRLVIKSTLLCLCSNFFGPVLVDKWAWPPCWRHRILGLKNPTKDMANWEDLLEQLLSHKRVSKFSGLNPLHLKFTLDFSLFCKFSIKWSLTTSLILRTLSYHGNYLSHWFFELSVIPW